MNTQQLPQIAQMTCNEDMNFHGKILSNVSFLSLKLALGVSLGLMLVSCAGNIRPKTIVRAFKPSPDAIDINRAGVDEIEKLPGIGRKTAGEIVEFRQKHGRFRRAEHLMLVNGISDKRFRKIRSMVKAE